MWAEFKYKFGIGVKGKYETVWIEIPDEDDDKIN